MWCAVFSNSVQCVLCIMQLAVCSVQRAEFSVQFAVCSVHSEMENTQKHCIYLYIFDNNEFGLRKIKYMSY